MSEIYDALRRVQEQREGRPPQENGHPTHTMLEEILRQAEAILRFSEDVQHRMAGSASTASAASWRSTVSCAAQWIV